MSDRLSRIGSNPTLRGYIAGAALQYISPFQNFLAPTVPVASMTGKYKKWDTKTPLIIPNTKRGNKGEATIVGFDTSDQGYDLTPNALDYPVDMLEMEDETLVNLIQEGADITAQLAALASHKETIDLALTTLGGGSDIDITTTDIDLVDELDNKIKQVILGAKGYAAMMEIRIMWGFDGWKNFKNHKSVKDRFKGGAKKESTEITPDNVASLFAVPVKQMTATAVYDANTNKDAADVQFMLDNSLIIFASCPSPTRHDTSFMKSLRLRGQAMTMRTYQRQDKRVEVAGFDWNEQIIAPTPGAGVRVNWTTS